MFPVLAGNRRSSDPSRPDLASSPDAADEAAGRELV